MSDPPPPLNPQPPSIAEVFKQAWQSLQSAYEWLSEHTDDIRDWGRDVQDRGGSTDPWRWLFDRVDAFTSLSMKGGLELERRLDGIRAKRGQTLTLLVDGAVDSELTAIIRERLERAPLRGHQREQLTTALEFVDAGKDHLAGPLLINTIEGVLWFEVAERGFIERNDKGKWQQTARGSNEGHLVHGVEQALKLLGDEVDDAFRDFLRAVVYGGPGDSFRHGTPLGFWQLRANFLVLALVGWLELHGLLDSAKVVRAAFQRAQERRRASLGRATATDPLHPRRRT